MAYGSGKSMGKGRKSSGGKGKAMKGRGKKGTQDKVGPMRTFFADRIMSGRGR